jgi:hypothetical protein
VPRRRIGFRETVIAKLIKVGYFGGLLRLIAALFRTKCIGQGGGKSNAQAFMRLLYRGPLPHLVFK